MKTTLRYNFNLPEDQDDFDVIVNANRMSCAVSEFRNYLRNRLKYEELDTVTQETLETVQSKFFECFEGLDTL